MKVLDEYPGAHHYWKEFEKTKYHCPQCGATEVWKEQGDGDYYVGTELMCTSCGSSWTMRGPSKTVWPNEVGQLEQLRSGITKQPTTKKGT